MNASQIFTEGHKVAKAIRKSFETYRAALSQALRDIYAKLRGMVEKPVVKAVAVTFESGESERVSDGSKMTYEKANKKIEEIYSDIKECGGYCTKEFIVVHFSNGDSYSFKLEVCSTQRSIKEAFENRIEWYNNGNNDVPEYEKTNQEYWKNFNYKY